MNNCNTQFFTKALSSQVFFINFIKSYFSPIPKPTPLCRTIYLVIENCHNIIWIYGKSLKHANEKYYLRIKIYILFFINPNNKHSWNIKSQKVNKPRESKSGFIWLYHTRAYKSI